MTSYPQLTVIMAPNRMSSEQIFSKLAPNKVIDNRFKISGGRLGVGNFGEVRLGIEIKTGKRLVISRGPMPSIICYTGLHFDF